MPVIEARTNLRRVKFAATKNSKTLPAHSLLLSSHTTKLLSAIAPAFALLVKASDVTSILQSIEQGDPTTAEELLPLVYDELRKLAAAKMAGEPPGQALQPTALVHEAWLRLAGENHSWQACRHEVFAVSAC